MNPLQNLVNSDRRVRRYGFAWMNHNIVLDAIISEAREVRAAIDDREDIVRVKEEVADLLHACISLADFLEFDIDELLVNAEKKFTMRSNALRKVMKKYDIESFHGKDVKFIENCWQEAKKLAIKDL